MAKDPLEALFANAAREQQRAARSEKRWERATKLVAVGAGMLSCLAVVAGSALISMLLLESIHYAQPVVPALGFQELYAGFALLWVLVAFIKLLTPTGDRGR